jgi:hypothetical protein
LLVEVITIDNQRLSMVVDLDSQIGMSVGPDDRKRFVFRPFKQIWARFGGNIAALQATQCCPPLLMSPASSIVFTRERALMALPSSDLLIFKHFRRRWPPERVSRRVLADARSTSLFESDEAAFGPYNTLATVHFLTHSLFVQST